MRVVALELTDDEILLLRRMLGRDAIPRCAEELNIWWRVRDCAAKIEAEREADKESP